ncbi:MAG: hypothetical protein AAFQ61_08500 [Cyanobacteria bacterium J06626_23]
MSNDDWASNYDRLKQQLEDMRLERETWVAQMRKIDAEREERERLLETKWQLAVLHKVKRFTLSVFDRLEAVLSK